MAEKTRITLGKRPGFVHVLVLAALALGILGASGYYYAHRHSGSTAPLRHVETKEADARAVVAESATSVDANASVQADEEEKIPAKETPSPTAEVVPVVSAKEKPTPAKQPVAKAPEVPPAPALPVEQPVERQPVQPQSEPEPTDQEILVALLEKLNANKKAWIAYSANADRRRAAALRTVSSNIEDPGYEELRANWRQLKEMIAQDAAEHDADAEGSGLFYEKPYAIVEKAVRDRLATLPSTPASEAELVRLVGYGTQVHRTAESIETSKVGHFEDHVNDLRRLLALYNTDADAMVATAIRTGSPTGAKPVW